MAEREGFEPPIGLHLCRISSAVHSTTLPPLLKAPSEELRPLWLGALIGEDGGPDKARKGKIRPVFRPDPTMSRWRWGRLRVLAAVSADWARTAGHGPARASRWRHRGPNHRSARKLADGPRGVGPPDAVNTGGPVPLIAILAGKGGFAGQVRRQFDPSVRPGRRNAKRSLT